MKIAQIIERIDALAPPTLAQEWDRVGLMIGDVRRECTGIAVALDITKEGIDQAASEGVNLIVTHHPFIWDALKSIDVSCAKGEMIETLVKHSITVYSAHTNLDSAPGGLNFRLAQMLGGKNIVVDSEGGGAIFDIDCPLSELARKVADSLGDESLRCVGDPFAHIKRAYVVTGSGSSEYDRAKEVADVLLTGEIKHDRFVQAAEEGFKLIEFSHYYSEIIVQDILIDALGGMGVKIIKAADRCPYWRINRE